MTVTYVETREVPLDQLARFPGNARRGKVKEIRASLRRHGQYRAVVVRDQDGVLTILAGNHTAQALEAEGLPSARCEIVTCDDDEARRINLADNRISDLGEYDTTALLKLLTNLDDLDGVGYLPDEVDTMVRDADFYGNQASAFLTGLDDPPPALPPAHPTPPAPPAAPAPPASARPGPDPDEHETGSGSAALPQPPAPTGGDDHAPPAGKPFAGYVQLSWTFDTEQRDLVRDAVRAAQVRFGCATAAEAVVAMARHFLTESEAGKS